MFNFTLRTSIAPDARNLRSSRQKNFFCSWCFRTCAIVQYLYVCMCYDSYKWHSFLKGSKSLSQPFNHDGSTLTVDTILQSICFTTFTLCGLSFLYFSRSARSVRATRSSEWLVSVVSKCHGIATSTSSDQYLVEHLLPVTVPTLQHVWLPATIEAETFQVIESHGLRVLDSVLSALVQSLIDHRYPSIIKRQSVTYQ